MVPLPLTPPLLAKQASSPLRSQVRKFTTAMLWGRAADSERFGRKARDPDRLAGNSNRKSRIRIQLFVRRLPFCGAVWEGC